VGLVTCLGDLDGRGDLGLDDVCPVWLTCSAGRIEDGDSPPVTLLVGPRRQRPRTLGRFSAYATPGVYRLRPRFRPSLEAAPAVSFPTVFLVKRSGHGERDRGCGGSCAGSVKSLRSTLR
jgi:hypothetical protein